MGRELAYVDKFFRVLDPRLVEATMKEKYVSLSSRELQLMLQGTLQWNDISPRVTSSKTGMRKLGESTDKPIDNLIDKPSHTKEIEQIWDDFPRKDVYTKRLEGQPVIWLLGSVGVLTISSWFYFVLFSK
ncbi:hypothetical protein Desmer_0207 [Desulfosporosinus meridiei DSM 13257]|uniref:Uncharacterized protein n=2 Tax=Desulfosporosinus TaxID=79206 RepID=J7IUA5_DESMD|nr:hypothetical protein Desmer_0207 [Desulfosporosinus meridiei DSM 13257]